LRRWGGAPLPIEIACGRRVRIKTRLICLVAIAISGPDSSGRAVGR
jgi:hypothetical protein